MVCVKLPESVLVVFHLLEQRSCQISGIEESINHFRSRLLLVLGCPNCVGQGSLLSAHVGILTAHDARYASIPRGTSTPNLPTGSSPKGEHGRAPLQSRRGQNLLVTSVANLLSNCAVSKATGRLEIVPPKPGFGAEPQVDCFLGSGSRWHL